MPPPKKLKIVDDKLTPNDAYPLACEGTTLLWRGDYQNARQLLQALTRRIDKRPRKLPTTLPEAYHHHRQAQAQRARTLSQLIIPLDPNYNIPLPRAPKVQAACLAAYGPSSTPTLCSLRELLGIISAYEWRKKGVPIPALNTTIHPHYGIFAPIRSEYLDLLNQAPLPTPCHRAYDIGTGTGILAALLAKRGLPHIIATDQDPRAITCAQDNIDRLDLSQHIDVVQTDLFPPGRAHLIVCNPPWIPARPSAPIEHAVYDFESRMLRGFLNGLNAHLETGGEGWLILSDLAEHLCLRTRAELEKWIADANLRVIDRLDIRPTHPRSQDPDDPLHNARAAEITSLWRLRPNDNRSTTH